ncbi:TPA: hypothetical protein U1C34_001154 [Streptococcus suis]|uniref:hypothetical protein n=1 Tax=Streptococcus TaxID=1301 RepID=UPI001960055A|nr:MULTISPECIES: hypothetical protein [Streptococcus]MBM7192451.1 hypothetical protein [Streptococcus suis]MBY0720491.1 hypothetical protein [Streptococcus sp. 2018110]MCO8184446.1 hypothetical protein [Streptococcus suis]MCO8215989.1 hypothetical protein [Streptococcus suis]MCO8224406.1 hypothetical protein [Streptococcus suis]
MDELLEKLKNLKPNDTSTIETDNLIIKNNIITTRDNSIQLHNISMLSKSEFKSPVSIVDYFILATLFFLFINNWIPQLWSITIFFIYAAMVYIKYKNHLTKKYFLLFNLGSSKNYYLYFANKEFRDLVFDTVTQTFNSNKNSNIIIDIKNEKIENQTIFKSGSAQTNISGNHNKTVLGNNNTTSYNGDIISNSNITTDSENTSIKNGEAIPWDELADSLQKIISENQQLLSEDVLAIFNQLLEATKEQNSAKFDDVASKNKSLFNNTLIKDIISGTASGILASLIINR